MGQPHDAFLKRMFSSKIIASQFVQYFFKDLSQEIEFSNLQMSSEEWVNEFLKKKSADIILKSSLKDRPGSIYFLIEAQAKMPPDIGIKVNRYANDMHRAHFEADKEQSFHNQILPIVINHSAHVWKAPTPVKLVHPLSSSLSHRRFEYIDLKQLDLNQFEKYPHLCAVLGVIRDAPSFETQGLSMATLEALRILELNGEDDIITSILYYLERVVPEEQHSRLHHLLHDHLKKGDSLMRSIADMYIEEGFQKGVQHSKEQVKSIADKYIEEGFQKGVQFSEAQVRSMADRYLEQGLQLGVAQFQRTMVCRLLDRGMSPPEIAEVTALDEEEVLRYCAAIN